MNVTAGYLTVIDTSVVNSKSLTFNIKKGKKVKIKEIKIIGRDKITNTNKNFFNRQDTVFAVSNKKSKEEYERYKSQKLVAYL